MVPGRASPYDPVLVSCWADRQRKRQSPLGCGTLRLMKAQNGCCPLCGDLLLHADREPDSPREWEHWLTGACKAITARNLVAHGHGTPDTIHVVHVTCQRRAIAAGRSLELGLPACDKSVSCVSGERVRVAGQSRSSRCQPPRRRM
jgi:RNA-directed DNA polymerase